MKKVLLLWMFWSSVSNYSCSKEYEEIDTYEQGIEFFEQITDDLEVSGDDILIQIRLIIFEGFFGEIIAAAEAFVCFL